MQSDVYKSDRQDHPPDRGRWAVRQRHDERNRICLYNPVDGVGLCLALVFLNY